MKLIIDLRQTSSRLQKEQLLKYANKLEQRVLYYTYHQHLRFGITNVSVGDNLGEPTEELFVLLDLLVNKRLTGDRARSSVAEHAKVFGDLIYLICRKDLDCGISTKTINKVFNNLIPVFKVQLAKEKPLSTLKYPLLAQIKYDGVRVISIVENGVCTLVTRNGKVINCPELESVITKNNGKSNFILDGEITNKTGKIDGRTSISGRINSAIKGGCLSTVDMQYTVFDYLSGEEFYNTECFDKYDIRLYRLKKIVASIANPLVKCAKSITVFDELDVNTYYEKVTKKGYEGLILKSYSHLYTFKRTTDWVKLKSIKSADLLCTGYNLGKINTKYADCIGGLVCQGVVENNRVTVVVGSGLSDIDRQKDKNYFIGKTIEIKYNTVILNKDKDGHTLFLPRFIAVRFDK